MSSVSQFSVADDGNINQLQSVGKDHKSFTRVWITWEVSEGLLMYYEAQSKVSVMNEELYCSWQKTMHSHELPLIPITNLPPTPLLYSSTHGRRGTGLVLASIRSPGTCKLTFFELGSCSTWRPSSAPPASWCVAILDSINSRRWRLKHANHVQIVP